MMTRTSITVGPRRFFARLLRNHLRLLVLACVMLLLTATIFLVPRTEGAAPPVFAGEPVNLVVTANSNTSITLGWNAPAGGGVAHYRVERSESVFGPFGFIGTATTPTFNDTTVTSQRAYLYRVRAVLTNGCQSEPGNMALGTAIAFEFNQLATQQVKAQHFHDVRTAINAVRAVANLPPANWLRPTLNGLQINAADVLELRNRLNEALEELDIPVGIYTDPILNTGANGTFVRAIHIEQLQTRSTRGVRSDPYPIEITLNRGQIGEFSAPTTLPLVPVHLSVLPDGRILFWGRDKDRVADSSTLLGATKEIAGKSEAYVWNITEGMNKADIAVFRPSERNWYIINSSNGSIRVVQWGLAGDVSAPGDYDGDGRADLAVFSPSNAQWRISRSSDGVETSVIFGIGGDVPLPADYDQDGRTDLAIYRPSNGLWGIRFSGGGSDLTTGWGIAGDIPVPADYDRDRRTDIAIFRPSENTWYIRKSTDPANPLIRQWGTNGDVPAPGDFNGDGTTDLVVYRPSDGNWYIRNLASIPESSQTLFLGTSSGATVAPADYDGDGKTDPAIFRGSQGNWLIRRSSNGSIQTQSWGQNGDVPVPKDYDGMLRVFNSTTNLFCSGHSFLSDGRLMVSGGHKSPDEDGFGEPHTNIFDFRSNKWVKGPDMNKGRWYPYNVTLNNGETLIISGADTPQTINNDPQIFGSCNRDLNPPTLTASTYPFLHLMPDGRVLMVQSGKNDKRSRTLEPFAFPSPSPTPTPNPPRPGVWKSYASTNQEHWTGSSVMFDSGRKVLVMGGFNANNQPLSGAEYIDLTVPDAQAAWREIPSMKFARTYHTSTILPDGKVLVTGGVKCQGSIDITCGTVMHAEMWDPTANPSCLAQTPWRTMAQQNEVRAYHSIAALLPDGRVLVGGGGLPGAEGEIDLNGIEITNVFDNFAKFHGHKTVEFYSPPYLFDANGNAAARPLITSAPPNVLYGQSFNVGTSGAGPAPKVSLVRLASVTHGFNQDQRHIFLNASVVNSSTISVTPPANSNECPPGHYMLFVMNNGVPSVAKIVRVGNASMFQTDVPVTHQLGNGQAFEQGFEFSSSMNGQITHIRYWKHPDEPAGNHVGRIWNSSGQQVAAVAFTCETASGWQEAMLTTPLSINAGARYRVSYNASIAVAKTFGVFDGGPITRGPLTGWAGYFSAGAGQYPATFSGSNLFADIVFKTGQ